MKNIMKSMYFSPKDTMRSICRSMQLLEYADGLGLNVGIYFGDIKIPASMPIYPLLLTDNDEPEATFAWLKLEITGRPEGGSLGDFML